MLFFSSSCEKEKKLFQFIPAEHSGIHFSNVLNENSNVNILNYLYYYNGAGVSAEDYNQDGYVDLYFTSNEAKDELYLNRGDFKFEEVSSLAHIENSSGWTTGVSNVDINNDGLMDLYVCKVSGLLNFEGHNLLFVNQGNDKNGVPVFSEKAKDYGLDFSGFSTQSVFLDYDLDGDLDMYLLNHSTHPNKNYGQGNKREGFDTRAGDRFYENINGKFKDISEKVGIFQGVTGYGLGVGVGDLNSDGYPDIYVGNDFFENDYLYINQKDGSFKDIISTETNGLGHTSHYSMGNDIADVNNDGFLDIVSLDMLPRDLKTYKTSGLEYPFQTYSNYLRNGFSPQYMQNTFHLNLGGLNFSEMAFLSGIAATEWSWSALFADFDNDSQKDLFVTNGIKGVTNDMDYIKYISNDKIQRQLSQGKDVDLEILTRELPEKKIKNFIFKNNGDLTFEDMSSKWIPNNKSFSHGSVYADLDNDGDLDLVVNNTDEKVYILENLSENLKNPGNYLKVKLRGPESNYFGIGAKVTVYTGTITQVQEHYLSRGYLSSLAEGLQFGLGKNIVIDSAQVEWYDGTVNIKRNLNANSTIKFEYSNSNNVDNTAKITDPYLQDASLQFGFEKHKEQNTLDFNKQILSPFAYSNLSPKISVGDLNDDNLEDVVIGGGKGQPLQIWIQNLENSFEQVNEKVFEADAISENTAQLLIDIENDGDLDIIVVSGGNEFEAGKALQPKLYFNTEEGYKIDNSKFKDISLNASSITKVDYNNDGFEDIFISANIVPGKLGEDPDHYLLENDGNGNFRKVSTQILPENMGMIQDVKWMDMNRDGYEDLIIVGHWIAPTIFLNQQGKGFKKQVSNIDDFSGWWNSLEIADFDNDGDLDIIAGNWGLNSRLTASQERPINLYINDFDDNGTPEPIITFFYEDEETVLSSKDELDQQMPFLKKKFRTYSDFANATFEEIFSKEKLNGSINKKLTELASCYFENRGNGKFRKHRLPLKTQVSPIFAIEKFDFDNDGFDDLLLGGNNYEISTQLGRLDASHGSILINNGTGGFEVSNESPNISGAARDIESLCIDNTTYFIITTNNGNPLILKKN
ncbi:VCBS repeat-containing protein [Gramella sp. MAR_2010_147]|uniref:VCBS repeat-containing protein n=1 Tax=Gramella sp. MAR_2010_147 TaxID=1250205 RepID=UPI001E56F2A6|nr:VCBS repeat-containing protein [Gramella sp. MAR_2010_147]